jgi:LuxR family maltose regulon positive regulatory protein
MDSLSPDSSFILRTKMHAPALPSDLVSREKLIKRMDQNLDRPLTLVCAPAGYGKSTLVSHWIKSCNLPYAWISLEKSDNDLIGFLNYFISAVQTICPSCTVNLTGQLNSIKPSLVPTLSNYLLNDLEESDQRFVLVLDDYQEIHNPDIHDFLNGLLGHPSSSMHLALICRRDPPLPFHRLRARNLITEIRSRSLRFTQAETHEFILAKMGSEYDALELEKFTGRLEGWAAGLRLLLLAYREKPDFQLDEFSDIPGLAGIARFLAAEVINIQPKDFREILLRSSIPEQFCAPLCEVLFTPEELDSMEMSGEDFIKRLETANLFVIKVNDEKRGYRYHRIFRDALGELLIQEKSAEYIAQLHQRVSNWLSQNCLIVEAIRHALAANDYDGAVSLVQQHRQASMNHERWADLKRWLQLFPDEVVEEHPELLITKAWVFNSQGFWEKEMDILDRLETKEVSDSILGESLILRTNVTAWVGDMEKALALSDRGLDLLPEECTYPRTAGVIFKAWAYHLRGNGETAFMLLDETIAQAQYRELEAHPLLYFASCTLNYRDADLPALFDSADKYLLAGQERGMLESEALGNYFLGVASYNQNDMLRAQDYFEKSLGKGPFFTMNYYVQCVCALALAQHALGKSVAIKELLFENRQLLEELENQRLTSTLDALEAQLSLYQMNIPDASRWATGVELKTIDPSTLFIYPPVTQIKVLIETSTPASRDRAAALCSQLLESARSTNHTRMAIELLALQAILDKDSGRPEDAQIHLEEALRLAEPGGWMRVFVDMGPRLVPLLQISGRDGVSENFIDQILTAIEESKSRSIASKDDDLADPLTRRELDVLELLAEDLTNQEIANRLSITPGTVKQHVYHIYQKLHVNRRYQAVRVAREKGILQKESA